MGRNRLLGAPYEQQVVTASFTTEPQVDRYIVVTPAGGPNVTVTLDPNAFNGDQVSIIDGAGNAAAHNITIVPSAGQTLDGPSVISADFGELEITFSFGVGNVWLASASGGSGAGTTGATGSTGATGASGATGAGTTGATGVGTTGATGVGTTGATGATGTTVLVQTGWADANAVSTPAVDFIGPIALTVPAGGGEVIYHLDLLVIKDGTPGTLAVQLTHGINVPLYSPAAYTMAAAQQLSVSLSFKSGALSAGADSFSVSATCSAGAATIRGTLLAEIVTN